MPPFAPQVAALSSPWELLHELEVGGHFFLSADGILRRGVGAMVGPPLEAAFSDEVSVARASTATNMVEVEAKKMAIIKCHCVDIQI